MKYVAGAILILAMAIVFHVFASEHPGYHSVEATYLMFGCGIGGGLIIAVAAIQDFLDRTKRKNPS
jgi:hypothetical protein